MIFDATVVVPGIVLTASGMVWSLLKAAALTARKEERVTRTLHRTVCDKCSRVWEFTTHPFDPDLGQFYDRTETCPACLYHAGRMVELDMDTLTPARLRAAFNTEEEKSCRI